jgi:MoxR-like ATPase
MERMATTNANTTAMPVVSLEDVLNARQWVDKIYADEKINAYILDIVFATREGRQKDLSPRQNGANLSQLKGLLMYGASPRASLSLLLAAKARAFLDGRAYVVPQDVKDIAPDVLRHRIVPTYEAEAEELTSSDIVQMLLDELRTP